MAVPVSDGTEDAEPGAAVEPDDPGNAAVPDLAGELDHRSRTASGDDEHDSHPEHVGARSLVVLGVIVVLVGGAALWAVLARGPGSRPATTAPATAQGQVAESDPATLFAQNCATCHGPQGAGLAGGGAPALAGRGLTAQSVAERMIEGAAGMPSFRGRLTDVELATLAAYVAALGRPG